MIAEIQIDEHLRDIRPWSAASLPMLTKAENEAITLYYQQHCSECDGDLTDEDWQADRCPSCGAGLLPF